MATQQPAFRIRWGKLSLALVGVLALLAVPITFVIACFTSLSFLTPLVCLALFALSFVGLRTWAIRERRRRAWERATVAVPDDQVAAKEVEPVDDELAKVDAATAAQAAAKDQTAAQKDTAENAAEAKSAEVTVVVEEAFDIEAPAADTDATEAAEDRAAEPVQQADERQDVPAEASSPQEAAVAGQDEAPKTEASTWSPREVPAPTYTKAQPVERELPGSLSAPEVKKPTEVTSIRKAERDRADQERTATAAEAEAERTAEVQAAKSKLDLDAVLERRRA